MAFEVAFSTSLGRSLAINAPRGAGQEIGPPSSHLERAKGIKTLKELTINSSKINSQRTRLADRRPSETFSVECAGQPKRKRSDHAKGKSRVRLIHTVDDAVLLHHQPAVKGVFGTHHRDSVLDFQGP
jgi:hypothetical protein